MTTLMPIDVQSAFSWAPKVARKCESKHWYACGADGRSGGRSVYGHVITKFSRMGSLPHFVTHGAPLRASRARAPLIKCSLVMCDDFKKKPLLYVVACVHAH